MCSGTATNTYETSGPGALSLSRKQLSVAERRYIRRRTPSAAPLRHRRIDNSLGNFRRTYRNQRNTSFPRIHTTWARALSSREFDPHSGHFPTAIGSRSYRSSFLGFVDTAV